MNQQIIEKPTQSDAFISMMKNRPEIDFNPYEILKNYLDIYVKEDKLKSKLILDLRIEYIKRTVCNYYSVTFDEINTGVRDTDIVEIRQMIQIFCREVVKAKYKRIGNIFSYSTVYRGNQTKGLDHTTVMSNIRKLQDLMYTEKIIAARYKDLCDIIQSDINNGIIKF